MNLAMEKFPTFCAHRGVSALMPENSIPSFAAAIALGAAEIEFDVWYTKDKKLAVSHDQTIDRISNGTGKVSDYTLEALQTFNLGVHCGWDVPFCSVEEIFQNFGHKVIMNIHLKETGTDGELVKQLVALIADYQLEDSVYIAASEEYLPHIETYAPHLQRTAIQFPQTEDIYAIATKYHCKRVQFWFGCFDEALIQKLHDANILCNVFYADTIENMERDFKMGVDVILTNRMDLAAKYQKQV